MGDKNITILTTNYTYVKIFKWQVSIIKVNNKVYLILLQFVTI